jgi:1-acyl-sn-glycerol-3-phosphate acyltransferase
MNATIITRAIISTGFMSSVTIWDSLRGKLSLERGDEIVRQWSGQLLRQVDVKLDVRGLENIEPHKTYVVMSNHQSLYDIPTILKALPLRVRMMAKAELFKVPIWAQAMKAAGFVPVHREQQARAAQDLRAANDAVSRGINIWIAPEGTRSRDGQLLPFKQGGFVLASLAKVPVLPVAIDGTRKILPAHALDFVKGVNVRVTVGKPVDPSQFTRKQREQFTNAVRAQILAGLT